MDTSLLTHDIATSLLCTEERPFVTSAEQNRPWLRRWAPAFRHLLPGSVLDQLWDSPLMRTYDAMSGSQPDLENSRMLARGFRMRLDDDETRIRTLETHIDHHKWEETAFISFTNCPRSLEDLADKRRDRNGRGPQQIVVIDPRVRFELGLPLLHCGTEMAHYRVHSRYPRDYWRNHYLCLWEVTPAEVVGIWEWDDLRRTNTWYEDVIIPAVNQQRQGRERLDAVPRDVYHTDLRLSERIDDSSDNTYWNDSDDNCNSEQGDYPENAYDSDDSYERVCEENFSGELMKMLEDCKLD